MKTFKLIFVRTLAALVFLSSLPALAQWEELDSNDVFDTCALTEGTESVPSQWRTYPPPHRWYLYLLKLQGTNSFGTLVIAKEILGTGYSDEQATNDANASSTSTKYRAYKKLTLKLQELQSKGICPR